MKMEEDLITKKYRDKEGRLKLGTLVHIRNPSTDNSGFKCIIRDYAGTHFGKPLYLVSGRINKWTEKYMTVLGNEQEVKIKNIKI